MRKIALALALIAGLFGQEARADWTAKDASLATITFKNPGNCTSVVCTPVAAIIDGTGANVVAVNTAGADAVSNTANGLLSYSRNIIYNGTTWDRWMGDLTSGAWVNVKASALPAGAATAAKQPALGTAGASSADVISVQGIASGTPQPVSGTFWQATQPVSVASIPSHAVTNAGTFATQSAITAASGSVSAGAYAAGALAAGAFASGSGVDGWDLTQGAKADSVCGTATGTCSVVSLLKFLNTSVAAAIPAGTAIIGKVGVDQTTPGTTNGVAIVGVNAATALAGNGVTGTGSQRVTIASDNSPVAGMAVGATGSAVPANAHYMGAASGATGLLTGMISCDSTAIYDASTSGSTELVAISGSKSIYVCGYSIVAGGTVNVKLISGTGTACATGSSNKTPAYQLTAQTGISDGAPFFRGLKTASGGALCINASAGVAAQAIVYYAQF